MSYRQNNARRTWDRSDSKKRSSRKQVSRRQPSRLMQSYNAYSRAGSQVVADLNYLRRFINTELHYVDVNATNTATTTPSLPILNALSLGDTATTRTGQSIKMDRCDLRFHIEANATSILNYVRVMVIVDKQANGASITAAQFLVSTSNVNTPLTFASQNRIIVLYDETIPLNYNGNSGSVTRLITPNTTQHVTYYDTNVGTVADISSNSLFLVYFSDQLANPPTMTYWSRLWFVDN